MSNLRRWLHDQRPRHQRLMSLALANVEKSAWALRASKQSRQQGKTELKIQHARYGWQCIQDAIGLVVDCGCPRDMWPEDVQEALPR